MTKSSKKIILLVVIPVVTFFFFQSCAEDPYPSLPSIIGTDQEIPVISSIEPPNEALAGVTEITINGTNFLQVPAENLVSFNGTLAEVLSASTTQLIVRAPNVVADSVSVKIATTGENGSDEFSNIVVYSLKPAVAEFYSFSSLNIPYGITTDAQENMYVSISGLGTKKIDNNKDLTDFAPKGAETFFNSMKFGPNNTIYASRRVAGIIQVQENLAPAAFVSSANGIGNVVDLDFDQNDMIWAGGSGTSIYRITPSKDVKGFTIGSPVNAIRVFENSLYVAVISNNEQIILKIPIISTDSIGTPEIYFNLTAEIGSNININTITFALDGDLIIGTNRAVDPIIIVHPDKSSEPLYPGLITPNVYTFAWGNGNFLYYTREVIGSQTVFQLNMQKPGAPYYGRD